MPESEQEMQTDSDESQNQGDRRRRRGGRSEANNEDDEKEEGGKKKGKGEKNIDWAERARRVIPERTLLADLESSSKKNKEREMSQAEKVKQDEETRRTYLQEAGFVNSWSSIWRQQLDGAYQSEEEHKELIARLEKQLNKAALIQARAEILRQLDDAQAELVQLHGHRADLAGQIHEMIETRTAREEEQQKNEMHLKSLIRQQADAKKVLEITPNDDEAKRAYEALVASVNEKEGTMKAAADEKKKKADAIDAKKKEVKAAEQILKNARDAKEAAPDDPAAVSAFEAAEKDFREKREAFVLVEESADEEKARMDALEKEWKAADRIVQKKERVIGGLEEQCGELTAHIKIDDTPLSDPNGPPPSEASVLAINEPGALRKGAGKVGRWVERDVAQTGRVLGGVLGWAIDGVKDMFSAAKSYVNNPDKLFGGHKHFLGRGGKGGGEGKKEGGGKKK